MNTFIYIFIEINGTLSLRINYYSLIYGVNATNDPAACSGLWNMSSNDEGVSGNTVGWVECLSKEVVDQCNHMKLMYYEMVRDKTYLFPH